MAEQAEDEKRGHEPGGEFRRLPCQGHDQKARADQGEILEEHHRPRHPRAAAVTDPKESGQDDGEDWPLPGGRAGRPVERMGEAVPRQ